LKSYAKDKSALIRVMDAVYHIFLMGFLPEGVVGLLLFFIELLAGTARWRLPLI
jgi:hypothetical protein